MKKPMMTLTILVCAVALGLTACSNPTGGGGGPRPDQWDGSTATGFAGGGGEPGDPYIISTSAQLAYLAQQVNAGNTYAGEYFTLTGDLDFNDNEWIAIGTDGKPFGGTFDGDGHVIHGLVITEGDDYQGLFGYLDGATVSNLGLEDVSVEGKDYVGGIAGYVTNSSIENCYSAGTVSGEDYVGGIAGYIDNGSVDNCYSTGEVNGEDYVGGIAGQIDNGGSVADCYSTAEVSGTGSYAGGIAGAVESGGSVADCAALNPSVTAASDAGRVAGSVGGTSDNNAAWEDMPGGSFSYDPDKDGTGITAEEIKDGTGFPFAVNGDPWTHTEGRLPILAGLEGQDDTLPVYITDPPPDLWDGSTAGGFAGGGGSIADPYRIRTSAQLAYLAQQVNDAGNTYAGKYFILTRNLDLDGHDWMAIGTNTKRFSGSFDGQENVISGIFIDKSDTDYQGLFGYLYGATVSNLGLEDVSITGQNYVGGIAGGTYSSSIENCYSTGDISGTNQVGGIAGDTYSNIDNCYSTGDISGTNQVGGIVGETYSSSIESCYSTGDISGTEYQVGGIVGYLYYNSSIDNCYSTGTVSGYQQVGGIAGQVYSFDNSSNIENCYSTGMVSGTSQVGGIAGRVYSYGSGGSNIKRCAALNPAVTASTSNAGRVAGYISGGGTFTDNAAWDEMVPGNVPFNADANNHGADISTNDVKDGTGFPFNVNEDPWTHTPGKLPTLKDLEGQEGTLPEHLK